MKKRFHIKLGIRMIFFLLSVMVITFNCERIDNRAEEATDPESLISKKQFNSDMKDFSLAVSSALKESPGFRNLIKTEALKMFDGDYDVLISDIVTVRVPQSASDIKSANSNYCVRDLLQGHISKITSSTRLKSSASPIDDLISQYPYLQIAVPVNAEEWDAENYVPVVTFLPFEYDDLTAKELTAFTPDGRTITLDAVTPPEDPVIVVSMNERIDLEDPKAPVTPPDPANLTGIMTESGIRLMWLMPDTADSDNTEGYYIYRKSAADANYILYSTIYGVYNRSFDDNGVESAKVYSYYVVAFYNAETSSPSNYIVVTAPQKPKPVLSFDAIQHAKNEVELRWQNDNSQYISETVVYKHVVGVTSDYEVFGSFTSDEHETFDRDITPGKKIIYKVQHKSGTQESNPKYDFVQAPYRDISRKSPVFIKQIRFTDWRIERWPAGKPEFYVTVTNVEPINKNPFKVQDQIDLRFEEKEKTSQIFQGVKVLDWQPGYWFDMLTFTAVEYDRPSGKLTLTIGVGYNMKDTLKLGFLQGNAGIEYPIVFEDKGEQCGNSYFDYFANPETWLVFPNYGVQIRLSETDN